MNPASSANDTPAPSRLTVSVRTLVEFVLQSGDLELTFAGPRRTLEGIQAHQRVQRARPPGYRAEVPVQLAVTTPRFTLEVSGRIDGVFEDGVRTVVDEIKSTRRELAGLRDAQPDLHWAQAKAYAWLLAAASDLPAVDVQLTYVQLATDERLEIRRSFSRPALASFFDHLTAVFLEWAETLAGWQRQRDASLTTLAFPFPRFRRGQRRMAVAVYRTLKSGGRALIQAPTGIGKTMSALFPALKNLGEGAGARLFYLTARTTGQKAAEDALARLRDAGLQIKSLTLTAKEKRCPHPAAACLPEECPRARGHFDRIHAARQAAFAQDALTREALDRLAETFAVCPFEFSLDLALWVDVLIADYNYAFDPRVYLRRFFPEEGADALLLVDEAHNLVDRAREMFSAAIRKQPFLELRRAVKNDHPRLYRALGRINAWMAGARRACLADGGAAASAEAPEAVLPRLRGFVQQAERELVLNRPQPWREALLERYFEVTAFLRVADDYDAAYATCLTSDGRDLELKLFCLDPSGPLADALNRGRAAVFFSATLTPFAYYNRMLGDGAQTFFLRLPSPFPPQNLCLVVDRHISTYFRDRAHTCASVAEALARMVRCRPGNYLAFFPSYAYLEMVHTAFADTHGDIPTLVQTSAMSEDARGAFLSRFEVDGADALLGFVVMGGIFGEGIDLVGERLHGAVIVGVGLPGIGLERDLIRDYFEAQMQAGFDFAYRFPGFNRVCQAVGRVIRTSRDRGAVLLVDRRYGTRPYRELFPPEWQPVELRAGQAVSEILQPFWRAGASTLNTQSECDHAGTVP